MCGCPECDARLHVASLLGGTVTLAAADAPYIGKWKANLDKSNFRETRVTYTRLPRVKCRFDANGQSSRSKIDGKDHPNPFGRAGSWRAFDTPGPTAKGWPPPGRPTRVRPWLMK